MPETPTRASICLLSTADWNAPLWTNKQYMARELGAAHDVLYVGSVGLRRPRLDLADLRRIADRITPSTGAGRPLEPGVTIANPKIIPMHSGVTRNLNERLLARTVRPWIDDADRTRVLWTYSPLTFGLEAHADHVVYHCVDLLGAYPGISANMIEQAERRLAQTNVTAIASSAVVRDHLDRAGFTKILHWPNVADTQPFREAAGRAQRLPRRVVFGGNVTPYKVDLDLVERLATDVEGIDLVLAGPNDEGGAGEWSDPARLRELGVTLTGTLTLPQLADLYATATVGIIPYLQNDYTHGVNPLKLFEYLSAGLSVVSTPVPSVAEQDLPDTDLRVRSDPFEFLDAVDAFAKLPTPADLERRTAIANDNSWTGRGQMARAFVDELIAR